MITLLPQQKNLDVCLRILYTNTKFKNYILLNINRNIHNRFRHTLRLIFLEDLIYSRKSKATVLSNVTGVDKNICLPIISTLESLMNHSKKLEDWKKHKVYSFQSLPPLDFRTCDSCGEKSNAIIKIENALISVNLPPFHIGCRCVARALFEHSKISGTKKANDPISGESFDIEMKATYTDWIELLEEKYGKETLKFQRELTNNVLEQT